MYTHLARFYDLLQGATPGAFARRIVKEADRVGIDTKSILELGSGTGAVLEYLPKDWRKTGVDVSPEMLKEAAQKQLDAELLLGDIRSLRLGRTFDVVACVYDTMNHIRPSDWPAVFRTAAAHLTRDGVFLFDINTLGRLQRGASANASVIEEDGFSATLQISQESAEEFIWNIHIRSEVPNRQGEFTEVITEYARPLRDVQAELVDAGFTSVHLAAGKDHAVNDDAPRVFFTCQR